MAKPICIIKLNAIISELVNGLGLLECCRGLQTEFENKLTDYYVLVIPTYSEEGRDEPIQFQVFYDKDFIEINFEELRELINLELKVQ